MTDLNNWFIIGAAAVYGAAMVLSLWALTRRRLGAITWIPRITAVGLALHFAGLVSGAVDRGSFPSLGLREILFLLAFAGISVYLLAHFRFRLEVMGVIILPLIVLLMGLTFLVPESGAGAAAAWKTSVRAAHIIPAVLGTAFLFVTFTTSIIYLAQERGLKEHRPLNFFLALPSLERCDRLSYISLGWGFAFLTLVVITGAFTNSYTSGDLSWIMREKFSLLAWLLFAVVIYDRVFAGRWRGRLSSYLCIIGFVAIILRMAGLGA
jgi:ABC-type uncharacterized transport system permease subunit